MADPKQLKILRQGAEIWNKWRIENPESRIELSEADLSSISLNAVNLENADLSDTNLMGIELWNANLSKAVLRRASLRTADLEGINLNQADLSEADLTSTNLIRADLTGANLSQAILTASYLYGANFAEAELEYTSLGDVDLSKSKGLTAVMHWGPSTLGIDTLVESQGRIPDIFLRGCGLSDWEIESAKLYDPNLSDQKIAAILYKIHELRARQPIRTSPLFISYSQADSPFVDRVEPHLNERGVRFWRDVHPVTSHSGQQIDRAVRQIPIVIVVLSEKSTRSDWVIHKVRWAQNLEKETGHALLFLIALDESWKANAWPEDVKARFAKYSLADLSGWADKAVLAKRFDQVLSGLDLFYGGSG